MRLKNSFFIKICILFLIVSVGYFTCFSLQNAYALPFYHLNPKVTVLRAKFYTSYSSSSQERKNNILLASSSLNNTFIDVGAEFSFNRTVGERTEKRGYQKAKIILNGEFADGVGGGVCQVSTTLYNAVLLSGLEVTEFHPHSLPVSYVSPSFDAMVNSGWADLKFVNNTDNPVIIKTFADGNKLTVEIYGEPMQETYIRKSVVTEVIPAPKELETIDEKGEYPDLYQGESMFLRYSTAGLKSQGFISVIKNGKEIKCDKIRSDKYSATRGVVIKGTAERPNDLPDINTSQPAE